MSQAIETRDVNFYESETVSLSPPVLAEEEELEEAIRLQRECEGDPLHRLEWERWYDSLPDANYE